MTNESFFSLYPPIPSVRLGELKDMAQEIIAKSASLEGKVALQTARALGDRLRYLNSYYSNLIEGHKTTVIEIENALKKNFSEDEERKYAQELCVAHVLAERELMDEVIENPPNNICDFEFVGKIHQKFYAQLPEHHQYTHDSNGFTNIYVAPGQMRDNNVSVDGGFSQLGPDAKHLPKKYSEFSEYYHPKNFHGDEKLLAVAASHHRLGWLHPFKDGNGRVTRLFSGLYLSQIGINQSNLWSLSRGFSRDKQWYMINLQSADSPAEGMTGFNQEFFADYCMYFLETCLDQINFMEKMLNLQKINTKIDQYINDRNRMTETFNHLDPRAGRLLKALFQQGEIPRNEAMSILNMADKSERHVRRIVSQVVKEGLAWSKTHKSPLRIGLPLHILPYYFPDLFDPLVFGSNQSF